MKSFGLSLGASKREPIGRIVDLVSEAENLGFQYAYVLDSQVVFKDVYVTLALCASKTKSIMLSPGVTNPVTRDLTVTASAISAIQEISAGRAVLGMGNGGTSVESIGVGRASLAATEAAVVGLRSLLAGEELHLNGIAVRMQRAAQRVPIMLSASRPKMLKLAGRVADGVILMGSSNPQLLQQQLDDVFVGLKESGRQRHEFRVDLWQTISVSDDRLKAIDDVRPWVASQMFYWFGRAEQLPLELKRVIDPTLLHEMNAKYMISEHLSLRAEHRALVTEELADLMTIAGTPDYCQAKVSELSQLDIDGITFSLLSGGREARLADLGKLVRAS